jgi:hypothetical protein
MQGLAWTSPGQRRLIAGCVVGTLAFVGLGGLALWGFTNRFLYITLISVIFPIILAGLVIQGIRFEPSCLFFGKALALTSLLCPSCMCRSRTKETFVAITNQRVIQYEDENTKLLIPFGHILSVSTRTNWLMAMRVVVLDSKCNRQTKIRRQSQRNTDLSLITIPPNSGVGVESQARLNGVTLVVLFAFLVLSLLFS